jgi:WD40 repeat protein
MTHSGTITDLCINQTKQLLLFGTGMGFYLYDIVTNRQTLFRDFSANGGIRLIRLLGTSNVFGFTTNNDPNNIILWDDFQKKSFCNLLFSSEVLNFILTKTHIIVVEKTQISVYSLTDRKLLKELQTGANPRGLCLLSELSSEQKNYILFPSNIIGNISTYSISDDKLMEEMKAHQNEIECMNLSADDKYVLTASTQGTLIRVHDIFLQEKTYEFRRGLGNATVYSIATDPDNKCLAVTSDTGTIHIYSLDSNVKNTGSRFGFMKSVLPNYFSSEWSLKTITIKNTQKSEACFRSINNKLYLIIAFFDGGYYKYNIDLETDTVNLVKHLSLTKDN